MNIAKKAWINAEGVLRIMNAELTAPGQKPLTMDSQVRILDSEIPRGYSPSNDLGVQAMAAHKQLRGTVVPLSRVRIMTPSKPFPGVLGFEEPLRLVVCMPEFSVDVHYFVDEVEFLR
jgi:hypothetical protein